MLFKKEDHLPMSERKELPRLTLMQRIQHILIFSSLLTLVLTGFPIKFVDAPWAAPMNTALFGMPVTRIIHRIAGTIFFGTFLFHALIYLPVGFIRHCRSIKESKGICGFWDMFAFFYMIPDKKDGQDLIQDLKYWFFLADHKSPKRNFDYFGKFGYMAVFWGIPIVGPSGVLLWFKEFFFELQFPIIGQLPGWIFSVVKIAHSDEVFLATIVLTVWHWYIVHYNPDVFPIRWTWVTGTVPKELLEEEHIIEYEKIIEEDKKSRDVKGGTGGHHA